MPPSKSRLVIFTVYEGVSLLDLAGPLEAFRVADGRVVSSRGGRVTTADGVELDTKSIRSTAKNPIDTLVVPAGFFGLQLLRVR